MFYLGGTFKVQKRWGFDLWSEGDRRRYESSSAISSLSRVTTPKSIGMHSKKKYVEFVRRVSPKMKYLGDFLTKDVATRELEPAKSASWCRSGIQQDASYCVRRFHVRLITGLLCQKSIPPDGPVNSVFLQGRGQTKTDLSYILVILDLRR